MARRKRERWTEDGARAEVAAWRRSGLSMAEHCRQRGIRPKKFYWWRRRLGDDDVTDAEPMRWVEAAITGGASTAAVTVHLRNGERVDIERPREVDVAWLRLLLSGLQAEG